MGNVVCTTHDRFEELEPFREEWDRFVLETTGDLYQSFDWCRVWWRYYGNGRELAILVFRSEDRLVGILPFSIDPLRVGPIRIRIAKILNSEYTACVVAPPVIGEWAEGLFTEAFRILFSDFKADAVSFGPISEAFSEGGALVSATVRSDPATVIVSDDSVEDHVFFHLPETFEAHFAGLRKSRRTDLRRTLRRIEETHGPIHVQNFRSPEAIRHEFPAFREMHDRYWHERGQGGHFVDLVDGEGFNLDLIDVFAPRGGVLLQKIAAGEEVLGYQYAFLFGDSLHWRLTARPCGEKWANLGVGVIGLHFLIREAINLGVRTIEGGPGRYDYKSALGAEYRPRRSLVIARDSSPSRIKLKLLRTLYRILDIVYYKIWYQRVVKMLGLSRGSIWQYYLRCRL